MKRKSLLFAAILMALWAAGWPNPAVSAEKDAEEEGFSAYSVARLKVFEGTAWVRMPDSGEWEEYTTNTPVPERARVSVPGKSEAELQFHGGQYVLLTGGTEVDVKKFDEGGTSFRLRSGEIRFDLPAEDFSPVNVALHGGKTSFNVPGRYWLSVGEDGETRLVVRAGEGEVTAEHGSYRVRAGEEAAIGKDVRISAYRGDEEDKYEAPPPMTEEERKAEVPPAAAYELRDYGEWVYADDYGYVWRPRVVAGWSPYFYGRWVWISPYGWTWVSYEPWGWYPYHFGWWVNDPIIGWCWSPYRSFVSVSFGFGSFRFRHFHGRAFFFPATVRFVRDGGFVRWVPLRPGERFVRPGFTRSNARLASWERPIPRGTVFVRNARDGKGREWKGWSETRKGRHKVVVRETDARSRGDAVRRETPQVRDERRDVKTRSERGRPEVQERRERMQRRDIERRERPPQREFRGREGRIPDGGISPRKDRPDTGASFRTDGARGRREGTENRIRYREMRPPARFDTPAREAKPKVVEPPPYRGEFRDIAPGRDPAARPQMREMDAGRGRMDGGHPGRGQVERGQMERRNMDRGNADRGSPAREGPGRGGGGRR
ncbi:MAG: hypothetical protein HY896_01945 [Deltaproteobacteria bacterium]|nr:hypothetical protein [Deltaproteobacteria bacterium]